MLGQVGISHEVVVSDVDETVDGPPDVQVSILALRKASAVRDMIKSDAVIIAADTLVYVESQVLSKPECPEEAYNMLQLLQGREHTVYTGVAVLRVDGDTVCTETFVESAKVFFRGLSSEEIHKYIATGEPFDKAGSYGVQEKGALLVERIEGDYFTVVGLPIAKLAVTLGKMGIDVWC